MQRWTSLAVVALFAALAPSTAWAQLDKVYNAKGVPTEGTITAMSPEKVTLDKAGSPLEFNVNEIQKIAYGDDPPELQKARDAILAGQLEQASTTLKVLNPANAARDVVKQDIGYFKAFCDAKLALAGNGNAATAETALFEWFRANLGSYHIYEASEVLGDLSMAQGKFEDASKRYAFLGKAPWPAYKLKANVYEARALALQKKYPEAMEKYDAILASGETNADANKQKMFATVGRAVCLAETGKAEEGIQVLEKVIRDNDAKETALFARTYNAMGTCYLKLNRPKDALLAYLRVELLFNSDNEAHAEALHHLTKLWTEVGKADRALAARTLLKERYAGSIWNKATQ